MTLTFLLGLLSALLIAVAFRHLATKPSFYFACLYIYFAVFSHRGYYCLAAIVFTAWVAVLFFASLRHFYSAAIFCHAIFIAAIHFIAVQPAISRFFIRLDLELPFLLWSCRRHTHFAAKDVFVTTTSRRPIFFFLLLFWLSFFSSFSRRHAVPIVTVQPVAIHILYFFPSLHLTLQHCSLSQ